MVGGGPTGVEMAGALSELIRVALKKDYRGLQPTEVSILLLEAAPRAQRDAAGFIKLNALRLRLLARRNRSPSGE